MQIEIEAKDIERLSTFTYGRDRPALLRSADLVLKMKNGDEVRICFKATDLTRPSNVALPENWFGQVEACQQWLC
jgi:hypothetical protein